MNAPCDGGRRRLCASLLLQQDCKIIVTIATTQARHPSREMRRCLRNPPTHPGESHPAVRLLLAFALLAGCDAGPSSGAPGDHPDAAERPPPSPPVSLDPANPPVFGTWYLDTGIDRLVLHVTCDATATACVGAIDDERWGWSDPVDSIRVRDDGAFDFRRVGPGGWWWYHARVVDGVLTGRYAPSDDGAEPADRTRYGGHVSGWRAETFDRALAPRVWDLVLDNRYRARLRLDRSATAPSGFEARIKIYGSTDGSSGEDDSFDATVERWDGEDLRFTVVGPGSTRTYTGSVSGRALSGTWTDTGGRSGRRFSGWRAEVLSHGIAPRSGWARGEWQERTRRRLAHLLMADNPTPASRKVTVLQSNVPPIEARRTLANRDDGDPALTPQRYHLQELQLESTLADPNGDDPIVRRGHAWLAVPDDAPPPGGYPVVIAVNGHGGSAHAQMIPDNDFYWYGDAFARHGFVVLAVDISHRPVADRAAPYTGYPDGDDPDFGNGAHPAIRSPGLDSDWEEDGERTWDVMRAIDYAWTLPFINPARIIVTGLSMGGEITSYVAALDPRVAMAIPAGYSPDLSVLLLRGSHGCWQWNHADIREYLDTSDVHALIAPRPLVVETGKRDDTFSLRPAPFAGDKQVMRRTRPAWSEAPERVIHYLHYDVHRYHVGALNVSRATEPEVRTPVRIAPDDTGANDWQIDPETVATGGDLFAIISAALP